MRLSMKSTRLTSRHSLSKQLESHSGAAHVAVIVFLALSLLSAGLYVYSVNRGAVQGYAVRSLENELKELKKQNAELRVVEAESKSLTRVEAGGQTLRMERATTETVITARNNTVAIR